MVVPVADDEKPFSEVVREYGQQQADYATTTSDRWKAWAEALDELIRDMPRFGLPPQAYDEDFDRCPVEMGASHVDPAEMRDRLYRVLADADAASVALIRAAVLAENRSSDLADKLADDECAGCGVALGYCWSESNPGAHGDCCSACSHVDSGEDGESRG